MSSALATVLLLTCVVNRAHGFWGSSAHLRCQDSRHALGVACRASVELLEDEKDPGKVEGTDLRILKYPHPALRAENPEITEVTDEVKQLAKEMLKVMYAANGVGLAAPQVGINLQLMVFNPSGDAKKWLEEVILINPRIIAVSDGKDVDVEGCLSFPDMSGKVERKKWIKIEALSPKGTLVKKKYTGWQARIFQHEFDHLDKTLYIDRLSTDGRARVQSTLDGLIEEHGPGGAL